ncbi:glycoside hydrolase family protein [Olivibacter sp. CPCC 100613]|uniref:glycoside hydrolase family protein n=1 Tax=Olivibacter sp. CPCC 100613 TaxID=3079931 RepID=UPI002FFD42C2
MLSRRSFIKSSLGTASLLLVNPELFGKEKQALSLPERMLPAPLNGGFEMKDYWVWDPSVVKGEDGLYHMFASRWSKEYGFGNWVTNSQIIRAVSTTPAGPYTFAEVVLDARGKNFFDGCTTHNARIIKSGKYYLLYYFGNTYPDTPPKPGEDVWASGLAQRAWMNKRIGLAWSTSVHGPWTRSEHPILEPRPGHWDASITSNPSPVSLPDGRIYLMYKSSQKDHNPPLLLGAAAADSFKGPYKRLSEKPLFEFHAQGKLDNDVEDPFVWWSGDHYELIMKDRFGHICGEEGGGIHALSKDGIQWDLAHPVKAYSRHIKWEDGKVTLQANFERPFLLFENGKATHLFAATGTGNRPYELENSWNMVIPLK